MRQTHKGVEGEQYSAKLSDIRKLHFDFTGKGTRQAHEQKAWLWTTLSNNA